MRKAYLKISLIIHPDKIGRVFAQATKAFQALVRAFERLSSPDLTTEADERKGSKGKEAAKTIARSNENCFRTKVKCPRCKQPWSEGTLDGNPPYFYNFLMTGLKQYSCSTCLCEFGCMTAIHACPHCSKRFEYSISDYHR
jgi:curved DNA-binding protein CbpA